MFPFAEIYPNAGALLHSQISLLDPKLIIFTSFGDDAARLTCLPLSTNHLDEPSSV